jgi:hypothetical protein
MTDEEVIDRFWEVVKCGRKNGPYRYRDSKDRKRGFHKKYWRWYVADRDGLVAVYSMFLPYLSVRRRERFMEAIIEVLPKKPKKPKKNPRRFDN